MERTIKVRYINQGNDEDPILVHSDDDGAVWQDVVGDCDLPDWEWGQVVKEDGFYKVSDYRSAYPDNANANTFKEDGNPYSVILTSHNPLPLPGRDGFAMCYYLPTVATSSDAESDDGNHIYRAEQGDYVILSDDGFWDESGRKHAEDGEYGTVTYTNGILVHMDSEEEDRISVRNALGEGSYLVGKDSVKYEESAEFAKDEPVDIITSHDSKKISLAFPEEMRGSIKNITVSNSANPEQSATFTLSEDDMEWVFDAEDGEWTTWSASENDPLGEFSQNEDAEDNAIELPEVMEVPITEFDLSVETRTQISVLNVTADEGGDVQVGDTYIASGETASIPLYDDEPNVLFRFLPNEGRGPARAEISDTRGAPTASYSTSVFLTDLDEWLFKYDGANWTDNSWPRDYFDIKILFGPALTGKRKFDIKMRNNGSQVRFANSNDFSDAYGNKLGVLTVN